MTQFGWLATAVILTMLAILIALPDFNLVSDGEEAEDSSDNYF